VVEKSIDLTATGPTIDAAVAEAVDRAGMTLDGITSFTVEDIAGTVVEGRITYRVGVRVNFTLLERFHE
jgi:flavin-binding protein dodecin